MDILKNQGKLSKLRITPYKKEDFNESEKASKVSEFTVLANPEKYSLNYKVNYNEEKASGANADNPKFESSDSPNLTFDFIFDGTGILQEVGTARRDVISQIEDFKKVVFEYEGEIHKPYHVKIAWGSLIFHGVLTSMTIEFKLFAPSGAPLRAIVKTSFKGAVDRNLRKALANNSSPDLTHLRTVKEGDTLPIMAERIYGDPKYYLEVAKVNKLINFRELKTGQEIFFPPIEKIS